MPVPLEHSNLGPSGWHRWLRCPGSVNAERGLPDDAGFEAAEGTIFHELVADCLIHGFEMEHFPDRVFHENGFDVPFDDRMRRAAHEGLDYIRQILADPNVQMFVETRVSLEPWCGEGQFGTADVILFNIFERWIIVFDWKYGYIPVDPEENDQAQGYVLGSWETRLRDLFDDDPSNIDVTVVIEQPRAEIGGGTWKTTMKRVLEFGEFARRQAIRTQDPDAPRIAGAKQCQWCKARKTCGTHAEFNLATLSLTFQDLDDGYDLGGSVILPKEITPERRSYILENRPLITRWFEDLHASAYHDASVGRPTPGLKLVHGRRPARAVKPREAHKYETTLRALLGDKAETRTLLTPAAAEDALGSTIYVEKLDKFVDRGEPKPILVPTGDRRPALASAASLFDDLTGVL